jgi:hypothetical protein
MFFFKILLNWNMQKKFNLKIHMLIAYDIVHIFLISGVWNHDDLVCSSLQIV